MRNHVPPIPSHPSILPSFPHPIASSSHPNPPAQTAFLGPPISPSFPPQHYAQARTHPPSAGVHTAESSRPLTSLPPAPPWQAAERLGCSLGLLSRTRRGALQSGCLGWARHIPVTSQRIPAAFSGLAVLGKGDKGSRAARTGGCEGKGNLEEWSGRWSRD